jgi:hypothetical protein
MLSAKNGAILYSECHRRARHDSVMRGTAQRLKSWHAGADLPAPITACHHGPPPWRGTAPVHGQA